ncbi:hypothetical protein [Deinococcus marmoris]|uniref:hypothetical protein n=1 Tax=Deinococcus marmoris TaxID=249408 RepID=UPI0012DDFB82|nr:hypothetical protein [Deinococcus marmoris]
MAEAWKVLYYRDPDGTVPVSQFLGEADLTAGEIKQIRTRLGYISQYGIAILGQRADVLETLEGKDAQGIYSLRCPNTPNNPRILLCAVVERTFVLLHGFKELNSSDYAAAIRIAKTRKQKLEKAEEVRQAKAKSSQPATKNKKGKKQ